MADDLEEALRAARQEMQRAVNGLKAIQHLADMCRDRQDDDVEHYANAIRDVAELRGKALDHALGRLCAEAADG